VIAPAAIIYAAKSTVDTRGSIPTQHEDCARLAESDGLRVVAFYFDEASSGYTKSRGDGLIKAKAHAAQLAAEHGTCALIVQHTDRLARGDAIQAAHLIEHYLWALKSNVKLRSVEDDHNLDDMLRAVLIGERDHEDSKRKGQAVKKGMERSARDRGRAMGGPAPYGYKSSGDKNDPGRLILIPEEAAIVRRVFAEYLAGRPQSAIAKGLLDDGAPTKRGGLWAQGMIARILRSPLYIGCVPLAGNTYKGQHEPIIEPEVFEKVQALQRARSTQKQGRTPTGMHLFRKGMLRCGSCGSALSPRNDGRREYYYCVGHRQLGRDYCSFPNVRRELIDVAVYEHFEKAALDVEATRRQLEGTRDQRLTEVHSLTSAATKAEREASEALTRVKRDYTRGAISAEDWSELRGDLIEEHKGAKAQLDRLKAQVSEIEQWSITRDVEHDALHRLAEIRAAIAGEIKDASGVASVRAALQRL